MTSLDQLQNDCRPDKGRKRVGRGPRSGHGKTSGRGMKGAGARSGYKRRFHREGGQFPLYMKLPTRGFTRSRHQKRLDAISLTLVDRLFVDGEIVNETSLREHGLITGQCHGVKILGNGELTKKLAGFEVDAISASAKEKLEKAGVTVTILEKGSWSKA
jgi:large subunit ribosomal protein L15